MMSDIDELLERSRELIDKIPVEERKEAEERPESKGPDKMPAPRDGYFCRQVKPCKYYKYDREKDERWCFNPYRAYCPSYAEKR